VDGRRAEDYGIRHGYEHQAVAVIDVSRVNVVGSTNDAASVTLVIEHHLSSIRSGFWADPVADCDDDQAFIVLYQRARHGISVPLASSTFPAFEKKNSKI